MSFFNENDELIWKDTTDENGKIRITNLWLGKYYYQEVLSPEYYLLNNEKQYFELNEEMLEIEFGNAKIPLPKTYSDEPRTANGMEYCLLIGLFGFKKRFTDDREVC